MNTSTTDTECNPDELQSQEIWDLRANDKPAHIKCLLAQVVDKIEILFEQEGSITGVSTGFTDIDELTGGLQPGHLIVVAGASSMGKTAFAMNIAENVALKSDQPVMIFTMEMQGYELARRMMSSLGRVDNYKIRTGKVDDDDWPRLTSAINLLAYTQIFIDDTSLLTAVDIQAKARLLASEHGQLGLIVVDYIQLMESARPDDSRDKQLADITRSLKALAKDLNVPVMVLSQLNRNLEKRPNKRPIISDLRDSSAIGDDADLIMFVYRDEVYNGDDSSDRGIAEIIVEKQRNGPLGTVRLVFMGQYSKFENAQYSDFENFAVKKRKPKPSKPRP